MFNIVLVEPEIPQNTGNISRTCAVTGSPLHLVHPLGFSIADKHLKRAGLDYWKYLELSNYESFSELELQHPNCRFLLCSTHGLTQYQNVQYKIGDFLVFGKETAGLPKELLEKYAKDTVRIPMCDGFRSLNLSNAVSIILYEALRQNGFLGMT
ncbi:MAG TPA: tRNA (uridine(34)/cytosine(34)/5-carboxymethylaminomethyluridine(34)-2'-O)-methyltransferase TrmL [Clostridia bacterium]|nr:tRNA (uridine(34)/cytosine(34)/5-carboxymethylaminomethyluridine(34)-2'-O)-methyltransferase TrmL [Clostridia bacterium]